MSIYNYTCVLLLMLSRLILCVTLLTKTSLGFEKIVVHYGFGLLQIHGALLQSCITN